MKPLRILHIGHSYIVRLNRGVSAALARMPGVDLTVAAPAAFQGDLRPMQLEPEVSPAPYKLVPLRSFLSQQIHIFWYARGELQELIRGGRFDVVFAWEEPYILAGYQIARAVGPTSSRFCFRTAQNLVKRYPPPFSFFERHVVGRAQGWVAGGELVQQAMLQKGFPARRSQVIPLGADIAAFRPAEQALKDEVRRELALSGPVMAYMGRLVPQKGLRVLMQALEQVPAPWSMVFLGSGPLQSEIEAWAKQRGLSSRVRVLLVRHQDVPRYLGACDLLLAPSQTTPQWREQFGRMAIEAFACRVPVIVSDSGELPFVVEGAGRVVPESDVRAWARAIAELLESPGERGRLAEAGYQRCQERFTTEVVARKWMTFYQELSASGPGSRGATAVPVA